MTFKITFIQTSICLIKFQIIENNRYLSEMEMLFSGQFRVKPNINNYIGPD